MTPKEKAEDLISKFLIELQSIDSYNYNNIFIARKCALIAVDEILKDREVIDGMRVINDPYWLEVKQEIKAITPDEIIRKYEDAK